MERELPQAIARVVEEFNRLMADQSEIGTTYIHAYIHASLYVSSLSLLSLYNTPFFCWLFVMFSVLSVGRDANIGCRGKVQRARGTHLCTTICISLCVCDRFTRK